MATADDLIKSYVAAGFKKINLDCSMSCQDDPIPFTDGIVAERPKKSNLVAGFVLRCFQHVSNPDLDTQQCTWRHNW